MISVAMTAYNESSRGGGEWILEAIKSVSEHDSVAEVIVVDDASGDWPWLQELLKDLPKVKLYHNEKNCGVYANKLRSVEYCNCEWVQICDSDDAMDKAHFDILANIEPFDPHTMYCSSFGRDAFDYRKFCGRHGIGSYVRLGGQEGVACLLNTGNHFLHRETFLSVLAGEDPIRIQIGARRRESRSIHDAGDSAFYNTRWLLAGNILEIVPGLEYKHRYNDDATSSYVRAPARTMLLPPLYFYELCRAANPELPRAGQATAGMHETLGRGAFYETGDSENPIFVATPTLTVLAKPRRVIAMSNLSYYGRFANQLFQYSFLWKYAKDHNLELQVTPWVGKYLFGLHDPAVTRTLPRKQEVRDDTKESPVAPPIGEEFVNTDFLGYAQFHTSWHREFKEEICELFEPLHEIRHPIDAAMMKLRDEGKTPIGIHLRRGDYGRVLYFFTTPIQWCVDWLRNNLSRFENPVLLLATEDAALVNAFGEFTPLLVEDLGIELSPDPYPYFQYEKDDIVNPTPRSMDFYPEFRMLSLCDTVLISNSTFSLFAAMLNRNLKECWRPRLSTGAFEQIDPWNTDALLHDHLVDYPDVRGIRKD